MENEQEWLERLADVVAQKIRYLNFMNETRYLRDHAHEFSSERTDQEVLTRLAIRERNKKSGSSFVQAMSEVITPDVAKQGDAVYKKVALILSEKAAVARKFRKKATTSPRKPYGQVKAERAQARRLAHDRLEQELVHQAEMPIVAPITAAPDKTNQPHNQPVDRTMAKRLTPVFAFIDEVDTQCAIRENLAWETGRRRSKRRGRVL